VEANMKVLFSIAAGLTLILGLAWLFAPQAMLASWGVVAEPVAVYMARRYGGLFFGYAAILWLARGVPASAARTAILVGGAVVTGVMTIVSTVGVVTGVVGSVVWSVVVVEALLAAGFTYYLAAERG
jgi:hypothetical protein